MGGGTMSAQPTTVRRVETDAGRELAPALDRFRLRARLRIAWLRSLWQEEGELSGRLGVAHAEANALLDDRDSPTAETAWLVQSKAVQPWMAKLEETEAVLDRRDSRLATLCRIFGLEREEEALLEACAAVAFDPSLGRLCAYLQDHAGRAYVTEDLVARLYLGRRMFAWDPESALYRWNLVVRREGAAGEPAPVALDPSIRNWLGGRETLDEALIGCARLWEPKPPLAGWPVEELVTSLAERLRSPRPAPIQVRIEGPRGSGRRTMAAEVARRLSFPLLVVDADAAEDTTWNGLALHAERHAFLTRSVPAYSGESLARRGWPSLAAVFPLRFAISEPGCDPIPPAGVAERKIVMPTLRSASQAELWRAHVPESRHWPAAELNALSSWRHITPGDIAGAGRLGVTDAKSARRAVRQSSRARFGDLAEHIPCPFRWNDLVVDARLRDTLEDFVFEARDRLAFWERKEARRQFPQGRGLVALLSGPPGVGKTMAAQVIAASLGPLDLIRVNLATTISKWVGETAKNFDTIIRRGAMQDCVLLFDECDAAFARRTSDVHDAQDRHVNTDTAHLLQAIESFPGIALLATNQKTAIDPAFLRRLRFVMEFPRPDSASRLELWRKTIQAVAGDDGAAATRALPALAECVEATGAQIKYAGLSAVFAARREKTPLNARHLLKGLERELSKEGRNLGDRERERILAHGA
jgi:hypothetical protein